MCATIVFASAKLDPAVRPGSPDEYTTHSRALPRYAPVPQAQGMVLDASDFALGATILSRGPAASPLLPRIVGSSGYTRSFSGAVDGKTRLISLESSEPHDPDCELRVGRRRCGSVAAWPGATCRRREGRSARSGSGSAR
jgi:hypothetical protein